MQNYQENPYLESTLSLPCPSCGSQLQWSAEHHKINCDHCGYQEELSQSKDKVVEQSLAEVASKVRRYVPEETGKKVFDCQNCGAKFMVESDKIKVNCGFCGSENVNLDAYDHQYIQPVGIIPFYISREEAVKLFNNWIGQGLFHPEKLKKLSNIEHLHGIYIPFWTYDAQADAQWSGQAGYYYYETVRERGPDGRMQNRQIRKIDWRHRSGRLEHFFDDVLVVASGGLNQKAMEGILPFRLEEVVNFDPRLVVSWESEIYNLEVDKGYQIANGIMDRKIRHMCSAQLGGDTQRHLRVSSEKYSQTFKHIILPVWICAYEYQNQTFHFTINGQTGKVNGDKPLSWIKIAIVVILVLIIIFGIYLTVEGQPNRNSINNFR